MRFTYLPNFRDNFHGALVGLWGTPKRAASSVAFALLFGSMLLFPLRDASLPGARLLLLILGASVLWIVLFTLGFAALIAVLFTRRQRAAGPHEITVSDELLQRRQGATTVQRLWTGVSRVKETRRAFIMYDGNRPVFSIEKSAIGTPQELSRIRQYLSEKKPGRYKDA